MVFKLIIHYCILDTKEENKWWCSLCAACDKSNTLVADIILVKLCMPFKSWAMQSPAGRFFMLKQIKWSTDVVCILISKWNLVNPRFPFLLFCLDYSDLLVVSIGAAVIGVILMLTVSISTMMGSKSGITTFDSPPPLLLPPLFLPLQSGSCSSTGRHPFAKWFTHRTHLFLSALDGKKYKFDNESPQDSQSSV